MSPSLDIMFNRTANLSGRRPLLETQCHPRIQPVVPPKVPSRDQYNYDYSYRPDYWQKPLDYYVKKETPKPNLDRREAELVFKFEPATAEYFSLNYKPPAVQYAPATPVNRVPDQDGPFVFGIHSPSQFNLRSKRDDDYDYSEVADETPTTVKEDKFSELNCCDKVEWTISKKRKVFDRIFGIKSRRKVVGGRKEKIKCVLVGDGAVGKSSLIAAYAQDTFRDDYQPTAYDTFNVVVDIDNRPLRIEICDTAGQDSMSELRELCYPGTDVLMLCFSVVRPETFRSVAERWTRAVANVKAPLLLIGTQRDLATDPRVLQNLKSRGEHPITESEAKALAAKINATYIETSSKTRYQLKEAFDAAILAGLPVKSSNKKLWKKMLCIS